MPHVHITLDNLWDPSQLNNDLSVEDLLNSPIQVPTPSDLQVHPDYDLEGELIDGKVSSNVIGNMGSINDVQLVTECGDLLNRSDLYFDLHDNNLELDLPKPEESIYANWNFDQVVS